MAAPLVILGGAPRAGKTAAARRLVESHGQSAHVLGDHFYTYLHSGFINPARPEAAAQNRLVTRISVKAASGYCLAGYTTVLEGIYGPWVLDEITQSIAGPIECHLVFLRPELTVLLDRDAKTRTDQARANTIRKLDALYRELGVYERFVLDTSTLTIDQTASAVLQGMTDGSFQLGIA